MSPKGIAAVQVICILLSVCHLSPISAYGGYFKIQVCTAQVLEHQVQAAYHDCATPGSQDFFTPEVTKPAVLEKVEVAWFLNTDGCPAINVTVTAASQGSPQDYNVDVLAEGFISPIFCGRVLTEEPDQANVPQKQTISMEIRCPNNALKAGTVVMVPVQVKGLEPTTTELNLPSCDDPIMAGSNYCIEKEKRHIRFELKQDGHSAVAIFNTKTAYPKPRPDAKVYAMIKEGDESAAGFGRWKQIQPVLQLSWPERTARFDDLKYGVTYQVVAFRRGEIERFTGLIKMKEDQKEPPQRHFIQRLQKRFAREASRKDDR